uniref:Protein tyrosine phosphatase 4A1 n=1 Tax=Marmota marmota marmota TaxID=9994 RepID=A0A8C5YN49_MARMA
MNRPAPVEVTYKNMRFLITHNPTNATLNKFIEELKKYGVTTIVRVCEATYDTTLVEKEGIHVLVSINSSCVFKIMCYKFYSDKPQTSRSLILKVL